MSPGGGLLSFWPVVIVLNIFISPVYGSTNTVNNTAVKSETTMLIQKKIKTTVTMTIKHYTTGYIKTDKHSDL